VPTRRTSPRETFAKIGIVAEPKKPPGRPPKFTHDVAWRVIALLSAGATVKDAAADVGVTPRAIQSWRRRAYSRDPGDREFVEFERALTRGWIAAAESGQRSRIVDARPLQSLDELLRDLASEFDVD
jgi:hypothetical protein